METAGRAGSRRAARRVARAAVRADGSCAAAAVGYVLGSPVLVGIATVVVAAVAVT